jgi:hypothetical protein
MLIIKDFDICDCCGAYFTDEGYCANGHLKIKESQMVKTLEEIQHDKLVKVLKQEYVHKKYYCGIKTWYTPALLRRRIGHYKLILKLWKEYKKFENV